jgi:hypothetical protein
VSEGCAEHAGADALMLMFTKVTNGLVDDDKKTPEHTAGAGTTNKPRRSERQAGIRERRRSHKTNNRGNGEQLNQRTDPQVLQSRRKRKVDELLKLSDSSTELIEQKDRLMQEAETMRGNIKSIFCVLVELDNAKCKLARLSATSNEWCARKTTVEKDLHDRLLEFVKAIPDGKYVSDNTKYESGFGASESWYDLGKNESQVCYYDNSEIMLNSSVEYL